MTIEVVVFIVLQNLQIHIVLLVVRILFLFQHLIEYTSSCFTQSTLMFWSREA